MSHDETTQEHRMFRETLRRFLETYARPKYAQWESEHGIPREFWRKLGDQGFLGPEVPENYGGAGVDFHYAAIIVEEFERIGAGLSGVSLHNSIVLPYLTQFGSPYQKQQWLSPSVRGELITALAITEPGAGSDVAGLSSSAREESDHFVVNGQKTFITNGRQADLLLVAVKTDPQSVPPHRGISLLWIETATPGVSRGHNLPKIGQHSQDTCELFFDAVRVPKTHVLGVVGQGFRYLMRHLSQERLVVALQAQIVAEEIFAATLQYVRERHAFGKPIGTFQNTQFKLAELATEITMGRRFIDTLIEDHVRGLCGDFDAAMAKWRLTDTAKRVALECLQLYGGYGYMEEYPIARRLRDVLVMPIYAGTNEIMKLLIARSLGLDERVRA